MSSERALLQATALEVVIPEDTSSGIQELLSDESDSFSTGSSGLLGIQRRNLLLIDERVRVLVLLSVPPCEENLLKSCLSRAAVTVEAWAHDVASTNGPEGASTEPVREMIYSTKLSLDEEPTVIARESDQGQPASLLLVWQGNVTLSRPRVRMLDLAVSLYSVLTVTAAREEDDQEDLLMPFEPIERNVLSTLRTQGDHSVTPYLPASALVKIIPEQPRVPHQHRIEYMSTKVRLVPATVARMSYHRAATHDASPCIIAALNVEVIPFIELQAEIQSLSVSIAHGTLEDLTHNLLPLRCKSKDLVTFLYRLQQTKSTNIGDNATVASHLPNFDVLTIHLELAVTLSDSCRPQVLTDLTTNIDFFQALNPTYGGPSQPMQRPRRPASLPLNNRGNGSHGALDTTLQPAPPNIASFAGVSISFTAPAGAVKVGVPFIWRVLINNRSSRATKLTIYPLPRMPRSHPQAPTSGNRHTSRISMTSFRSHDKQPTGNADSELDIARAVVDENIVYAMQHSHTLPMQTDLVALTAELRVGSLGPGQCHEGEIEFLALKPGTFQVDTIRIVDVLREVEEGISSPGVMLDIRDLPDIVAEP